jgi:hypothetical protein
MRCTRSPLASSPSAVAGSKLHRDAAGIACRLDGGETVEVELVVDLGGYGGGFDGCLVG